MNTIKWVLSLGYCVQGFRCFPWLAINYFLKDGLNIDHFTLQIILTSVNLPMVAKPLYGIVSDSVYFFGEHRLPYLAFGALLQAISWVSIAILSSSNTSSIFTITFYLLMGNLGASISEVANDAIVAEIASGDLTSFVWTASALGGILGNLIGGVAATAAAPPAMFLAAAAIFTAQFLTTILVRESSLNLPNNKPNSGIKTQLVEVSNALSKPEIGYSIAWFSSSYAIIPFLSGTMFYYQTQGLGIDPSVLGLSKVFGQVWMLLWGVIYDKRLKSSSPRRVISALQATLAILIFSDVLFVNKLYKHIGVSDTIYVVIFSGLSDTLIFSKILPFNVLIARVCPLGCEGSLMAFVASATALALIVGGYFGVVLASFVGVTDSDFSRFPLALMIQAACTMLPLLWSSWIFDRKVEIKAD